MANWIKARQVFRTSDSTSMKDETPIVKPVWTSIVGKRGLTGECRNYLINLDSAIHIADWGKHRLVIDGKDCGTVPVVRIHFAATDEQAIEEKLIIADFNMVVGKVSAERVE